MKLKINQNKSIEIVSTVGYPIYRLKYIKDNKVELYNSFVFYKVATVDEGEKWIFNKANNIFDNDKDIDVESYIKKFSNS